jgi:hypothetical protein
MYAFVRCQFQQENARFYVIMAVCSCITDIGVSDFACTEITNRVVKISDADHKLVFTEIWDKY